MSRNNCLESTGGYRILADVTDVDGVNLRVTFRRTANGTPQYSFRFYREFARDGKVHETSWMGPQHVDAVDRLRAKVQGVVDEHRASEMAA